ncbi:MAG TPA: regulatory protein RecX [Acidobacteriaceae bacterium]|nr:regulatory protein RecX [Acidobacteriaceae bacterium]
MRSRKPPAPLDDDALYGYAVRLLGQQMRTVAEVKRLLRRRVEKGETGEARIEAVIARLKEYKYLNDTSFAQDYAKLRQENASFGKRRVQQDLIRKGVHTDVIAKTIDAAYEGVSEDELARRHLERKRIRKPGSEKEAARVARMLMRAGFSMGTIVRILKKWEVDETALAAMEIAEPEEGENDGGDHNGEA